MNLINTAAGFPGLKRRRVFYLIFRGCA